MEVTLNTEEMKGFLKHIIENNRELQKRGVVPVAVNVESDAGIGKTSLVKQLKEEMGIENIVRLNLATMEELGDLVGFPLKEYEIIKEVQGAQGSPTTKWVPESTLPQYIANGYKPSGERRMSHAAPEFIHGKTKGGILLLDDYTRADQRFMQATMTLIETQQYMAWKLPEDWHIILTTNPDDGNYNVTSLDGAQKTRVIKTKLKFDVQSWAKWAEKEQVDSRCINFLLLNPDTVTRDTNPRSIMIFFNSISSIKDFDKSIPLIQLIGEGSVGPEFSTMFSLFINNKLDKLMSPQDMLLDPNETSVFNKLTASIGKGDNYRADIASTLTTRLINFTTKYAEENKVEQPIIDRLVKFCTNSEIFTDDLKYLIVKKVYNANTAKFKALMNNIDIQKISVK